MPKHIILGHIAALILPAVLYVCETWAPTLREEHRLKVCENRVLRIFGEPINKENHELKFSVMY
jgi:hypothetical protein